MVDTIPARALVSVTPNVLSAGGGALSLIGLLLTNGSRVPIGTVQAFSNIGDVSDYFGATSDEFDAATVYFNGFDNSNVKPGSVLFAQYNESAASAWTRGSSLAGMTLDELQDITGTLDIEIDGVERTTGSISLSAATSFSNAAAIIQAALIANSPVAASVTGIVGGRVTASAGAVFVATGSGATLTVASVSAGVIHIGDKITGTGVPANTTITAFGTGTGGTGTYTTSNSTTASSATITATSNIVDVTVLTRGSVEVGAVLSGTGVTAGTLVLAQLTGAAGGVGTYAVDSFQQFASTTVDSTYTVLNVTVVGSGTLAVGSPITGTGIAAGTIITAILTGTGGVGTYRINNAASTASITVTSTVASPAVTYDSVSAAFIITSGRSGAVSTIDYADQDDITLDLKLTESMGALISQGAAAADPSAFMTALVEINQNWATFMTVFNPDGPNANDNKLAFAEWTNAQNQRYLYACWDPDTAAYQTVPATESLGYLLGTEDLTGTCLIWARGATDMPLAAFVCGYVASLDFAETNGRATLAFRQAGGITANVTSESVGDNLFANGYNFYGSYATANENFNFFQNGHVSGDFQWVDSYVNQIWLNNALQLANMELLAAAKSIPYNSRGYAMIEAAAQDPIVAALNFGAIQPGVTLSQSQAAQVNSGAGVRVSDVLSTQGYYYQVKDASPQVRQARASPPCTLWYMDGQSVQKIDIASVALQ